MAFSETPTYDGPLVGGDNGSPNQGNSMYLQFGTAASRPAQGNKGVVYWATDTLVLSYDNGSAWTDIATLTEMSQGVAEGGSDTVFQLISGLRLKQSIDALASVSSTIITGTRTAAAGSGDQAITGVGFTPTAVIALGDASNTLYMSIGIGDDAVGEGAMSHRNTSTFFIGTNLIDMDNGGSVTMRAVVKTLDSDGLTLTWTKGGAGHNVGFKLLCLR